MKINALALGYAGAVVYAVMLLLLGILGNLGFYTSAVEVMQQIHIFYSLSIGGIVAGMVEAAICGFLIAFSFGWLYNKFVKA